MKAPLVVGADGRQSIIRHKAGFEVMDFGSRIDVVWFRLPRLANDPVVPIQHMDERPGVVIYDRGDTWRCGLVILKGSFLQLREAGLDAFKKRVAPHLPFPAERLDALHDWGQTSLLPVRLDRIVRWWAPGLLCIGDAAHAMSPAGGVGVNLAIQDAVATARILAAPLREGRLTEDDLAAVEERRLFPTWVMQTLQRALRAPAGRNGQLSDVSGAWRPPSSLCPDWLIGAR